jgi:hypothetical protein
MNVIQDLINKNYEQLERYINLNDMKDSMIENRYLYYRIREYKLVSYSFNTICRIHVYKKLIIKL